MCVELVVSFNHLIMCHPILLLPSIFSSIRVFSNELVLRIRWPMYWRFIISPSSEYSGLISLRIDWFDLLAVQGTLKSLLQHYNSKVSIFWHLAFFTAQLSHVYMTTGKTIALTRWTLLGSNVLRVPWTARRSNQSVLKDITPGCSLEGLMLKLKLQYFGHLMRRIDSLEKTLMLGGMGAGGKGDDRGWDGWMGSPTWWPSVWVNSGSWWRTGRPGMLRFMGSQRVGHEWATELNWMSLLFNILSRLVIAFLPRSKCLLISWLQSPSAVILEPPKIKSLTLSTVSPSIYHEVMGPEAMILVFWMLSFKPAFSLSSFTFIKMLFSSSLSKIRVVSSACLRLLIFLPASWFQVVLHPVWHFKWCLLHVSLTSRVTIYSLDILPFQFGSSLLFHEWFYCCFLTCISISQEVGKVAWYSHLLKNFPVCCDPHSQSLWHSQ